MTALQVFCHYCGGRWQVSEDEDFNADAARTCPHCGKQIQQQTWQNYLLPVLGAAADAASELYKDTTGYNSPFFTFCVMSKMPEPLNTPKKHNTEKPQCIVDVRLLNGGTMRCNLETAAFLATSSFADEIISFICKNSVVQSKLNVLLDSGAKFN